MVGGDELAVDAILVDDGWLQRPDEAPPPRVEVAWEHLMEHAAAGWPEADRP
jgi:hypothetical protein